MAEKNNTQKTNVDFGYYSKILKEPFDSIDELREAEEAYYAQQRAKEAAATQKKADAAKVEDAFKALNAARKAYKEDLTQLTKEYAESLDNLKKALDLGKKDIANKLAESEKAFDEALKNFTNTYGQYHFTLKGDDFETTISGSSTDSTRMSTTRNLGIFDALDSIFDW